MRKHIMVSFVLVIGLTLGACAQNPASPQVNTTVSPPSVPTATQKPGPSTPEPVNTPVQKPTTPPEANVIPPFDISPIIADLANQTKTPADQIRLVDWQPVNWRDSCLGVRTPKQACLTVITPGFVLVFKVGQTDYTVHSDASGKNFRLAENGAVLDQLPALSWTRSGGIAGICQGLTAYSTGNYILRDCNTNQILVKGVLPEGHQTYLNGLWEKYATFEWHIVNPPGSADMFNDQIRFYGLGAETITEDQQQSLNQYLSQLANELASTTASNDASGASSGIIGQVLVGPTCGGPVGANSSTECADQPYPTTVTVLDPSGQTVTTFTTDSQGRFRVPLPPGAYTLHPASTDTFPAAIDQNIEVTSGQYLAVTIMYDSGKR